MAGTAISEKQSRALNATLSDLMVLAEADAVFLSDFGGNLLAYVTSAEADDSVYTIAALAAGSFSATRELAAQIKEPEFHSIFHQGENNSIYMQSVSTDYLVLVVFGKRTTAGLVKLYVEKAAKEIEPVLKQVHGQSVSAAGGETRLFEMKMDTDVFKKT